MKTLARRTFYEICTTCVPPARRYRRNLPQARVDKIRPAAARAQSSTLGVHQFLSSACGRPALC